MFILIMKEHENSATEWLINVFLMTFEQQWKCITLWIHIVILAGWDGYWMKVLRSIIGKINNQISI